MSDYDCFVNWLYNNDEYHISDDSAVYALELVREGKSIDEVKKMIVCANEGLMYCVL